MAVLTVYEMDYDGVNVESAYVAAAVGQIAPSTGREFIHIKNASGGSITCTLSLNDYAGIAVDDVVITVGATTGEQMAGPFSPAHFNATTDGVALTWSATASVTVGVFRLP